MSEADESGTGPGAASGAAPSASPSPGLFCAVVGPSGAGKDTLIRLAAERLPQDGSVLVARRVVTRPALAAVEDHDVMSPEAFAAAKAAGAFCLSWEAHGLCYGLPAALAAHVAASGTVIANLSRRTLDQAAERFPRLGVVEVTAPRAVLLSRIAARGRESREEIAARLDRAVPLRLPQAAERFARIVNDAAPEDGADKLVRFLGLGAPCYSVFAQ
ncbi:phosphonate metabolism protein/1,5-bisphosphokinase (PRPP-forming) PhnN [Jiella sp. M17.18]|uniref:phosphonate metabolism protein/1,5-bisphosphokinase (PRPP-forming) PhnN n=1 Tax=Jiella sp. M17.18 TaxID=3234247 RepID=UPI0034DFC876